MSTKGNGRSATAQRPMEWMRFDPVKFGLLVDGESFEVEGAFARIIRHLWNRGPLPEAEVRRILKGNFEVVRTAMFEVDGNLSLELVEDARAHGQRRINQRVEAGIASAAKRNDRSTKMNDRSTDVLSMSMSSSKSTQEKKERARDDRELNWPVWGGPKCRAKWAEFVAYRVSEKKLRYKTVATEQRALDLAARYFPSGPDFVAALDHTMARTWAFPVDPSEHKYPDMDKADAKPSNIKPWLQ